MVRVFESIKKIDKKKFIMFNCIKTVISIMIFSGNALYNHYNDVKLENYYKGDLASSINSEVKDSDFVYVDIDDYYSYNRNNNEIGIVYNSSDDYNKIVKFISENNIKYPILYNIDELYKEKNKIYNDIVKFNNEFKSNNTDVVFYGNEDNIKRLYEEFYDNNNIYLYNLLNICCNGECDTSSNIIINDDLVYISEGYFR